LKAVRAARFRAGDYDNTQGKTNADRYCEVVQYNEGLRVHRAQRRLR
jgi:hypothetical protein